MAENKATLELVTAYEAGLESGYEKGVRDMWVKARRISQFCFTCNNVADKTCVIDNCPIAKKLLKAVVK